MAALAIKFTCRQVTVIMRDGDIGAMSYSKPAVA